MIECTTKLLAVLTKGVVFSPLTDRREATKDDAGKIFSLSFLVRVAAVSSSGTGCVHDPMCQRPVVSTTLCVQGLLCPRPYVSKAHCVHDPMCQRPAVSTTLCVKGPLCPRPNVSKAHCVHDPMCPRLAVFTRCYVAHLV